MAASRKLYYENLRPGDELPPLVHTVVDRVAIARYAGAADDYNPMHVDEDYARRCGFPGTFAHPTFGLGLLAEYASSWLRGGAIRRLSARFVKIVWPGDQLTCRGRVVDRRREGGDYHVDLELWLENQRGELVVKGNASARLFHSPEDEDRQRRGLSPLIVEDPPRPTLAEVFERELPRAVSDRRTPAKKSKARPPTKKAAPPRARPKKGPKGKARR